ncbi:MAG: hypothetical protein WBZ33_08180 [Thermoactinomyces sp.]
MKFKKILPNQSPLGWIITAGVVAITSSPAARKKLRQLAVKGTSAVLGLSDQLKGKVKKLRETGEKEKYDFDFSNWEGSVPQQPEKNIPPKTEDEKPLMQTEITFSPTASAPTDPGQMKMEKSEDVPIEPNADDKKDEHN